MTSKSRKIVEVRGFVGRGKGDLKNSYGKEIDSGVETDPQAGDRADPRFVSII